MQNCEGSLQSWVDHTNKIYRKAMPRKCIPHQNLNKLLLSEETTYLPT